MLLKKQTYSSGAAAVRLLITGVFLLAAAWLWLNQQQVLDQVSVWQYKPTSEVASLANRSSMSERGTFLFYASQPVVDGTQKFNDICNKRDEAAAILGCYNGSKIYIYDVKDDRLNGIKEVTAAHEMLHVAYQRLPQNERETVDEALATEYKKLESQEDYKTRMAFYDRTEPGEALNELHSMIGTEISQLPPVLESHYGKYFSDRTKVVGLYENYQDVFHELEAQADDLYTELTELSKRIKQLSQQYNADVTALNRDIQAFNARASGGAFGSQSEFAARRAELVDRAGNLGATREQINASIQQYEQKRQQYNAIAEESKMLADSINSSLAPAPSV